MRAFERGVPARPLPPRLALTAALPSWRLNPAPLATDTRSLSLSPSLSLSLSLSHTHALVPTQPSPPFFFAAAAGPRARAPGPAATNLWEAIASDAHDPCSWPFVECDAGCAPRGPYNVIRGMWVWSEGGGARGGGEGPHNVIRGMWVWSEAGRGMEGRGGASFVLLQSTTNPPTKHKPSTMPAQTKQQRRHTNTTRNTPNSPSLNQNQQQQITHIPTL